jgi:hypothetical protein
VIAALFAALFALLATVADQSAPVPAPHGVTVSHEAPAPAVVAPAAGAVPPAVEGERLPRPSPTPTPPTVAAPCPAGEELQGDLGCVAPQLAAETDGRAYG